MIEHRLHEARHEFHLLARLPFDDDGQKQTIFHAADSFFNIRRIDGRFIGLPVRARE